MWFTTADRGPGRCGPGHHSGPNRTRRNGHRPRQPRITIAGTLLPTGRQSSPALKLDGMRRLRRPPRPRAIVLGPAAAQRPECQALSHPSRSAVRHNFPDHTDELSRFPLRSEGLGHSLNDFHQIPGGIAYVGHHVGTRWAADWSTHERSTCGNKFIHKALTVLY